ncbi:MAG: hypothetical protein JWO03_1888 [Bacteroidetes bacterium]|nr:hypothetical protein [Bacteroidota bacterium]
MDYKTIALRKQISYLIWFFMVSLAISGLTAIPAKTGISFLLDIVPQSWTPVYAFLMYIREALFSCNEVLFYGYDWLAFAHIVIAVLFYGVIKDPVRNIWVVEFGMIACMLIIPFAFAMGAVRGIPVWWRLVDCSFGVVGIIPLWFVHSKIRQLQKVVEMERLNTIF